ncbi:beta-N-acetylglucosaminidase domain-containing protein [Cellulomonas denverensis]|uniref:GH84 domain-containing protein n=1 Tax=Cellulomonas denverensis TaxID=264297 RepID=A0A7X6KVR0_9CELL|nr:beta-N-acetylglucosaminidase domain-containing protein [Cellulomonas denverensis]NKY23191.1 hypothetical protein [Cellulomonas denverensis]GIG26703.1 hypothetical protein Cde04nite_29470 [Cellulomonas denverensis]
MSHTAVPQSASSALSAGVVEGFYGPPWSHEERLSLLDAFPGLGLDTYLYAPKDDPWHRERWREPYPADALARLAELAARAADRGVRFVWSIAPGLSMRYADDAEYASLVQKAEQVWTAGVADVWLLFDDIPDRLSDPADAAVFGDGPRGAGRAHGEVARRFRDDFLTPHGLTHPMTVCPTDYAGCERSDYRDGLARTLPADARVIWTGRDVVVGDITREDVLSAAESYGRRLVLWDNFPVNDFDRTRLFLGPLLGRPGTVADLPLDAIVANGMIEAVPTRLALASVGRWAHDPAGYDPAQAAAEALATVAGEHAGLVAPVVRACSSWPPSAPRDPELSAAMDRALAGDPDARAAVTERMRGLAAGEAGAVRHPLVDGLRPLLAAGVHAGVAGLAACRVLERPEDPALRAAAAAALGVVELDYPDVFRSEVTAFVRAVLSVREGDPGDDAALDEERTRRRAVLIAGDQPTDGDRATAEWLRGRGLAVRLCATWTPGDEHAADLVVLTPTATAEAAAAVAQAAVPVLAYGRLLTLGVATDSGVLLGLERLTLDDGSAPVVHRGPGAMTWCQPVPDARVLARAPEPTMHPVLCELAAGAAVADGSPAPAARTTVFLGSHGAARWLVGPEGWRLLDEALDRVLAGRLSPDAGR